MISPEVVTRMANRLALLIKEQGKTNYSSLRTQVLREEGLSPFRRGDWDDATKRLQNEMIRRSIIKRRARSSRVRHRRST
jgi:hypothetical protein